MSHLGSLPLEIVDLIANDLSLKNTVSCICVSREWHDVFERVIYRTVDTRFRSKFMAFSGRLLATVADPNPLGHFVRMLSISDGFMTMHHLRELQKLCPFLDTLTFRWFSGRRHDSHMKTRYAQTGSNRRYFGTPERILGMFEIRKLKLVCDTGSSKRRVDIGLHDPTLYLKGAQDVQELSITGAVSILTYSQMDAIHLVCPKLTYLRVNFPSRFLVGSFWSPTTHETRELDGPGWIAPARSLQHIQIDEMSRALNSGSWMRYFSAMYPNLCSISMSNRCTEWAVNAFDEDVDFSPINYPGGALLADRCPRLKRITLNAVATSADVLKHMFAGKELHEVAIKDVTSIRKSQDVTKLVEAVSSTVTSLGMALSSRLITRDLIVLASCKKLVELKLVEVNNWIEGSVVSIDWLLKCCPMLLRLTLVRMNLDAFTQNKNPSPTHLKTLHISNCNLCCTVMRYLSTHCPNLINLSIIDCKGSKCQGSRSSAFRVHLKAHNLHNLTIVGHHSLFRTKMRFMSLQVTKALPSQPGEAGDMDYEGSEDSIYDNSYLDTDITYGARYHLCLSDRGTNKMSRCLTSSFTKLSPLAVRDLRKSLNNSSDISFKPSPESISDLSRCSIEHNGFLSICCASVRSLTVDETLLVQNNIYMPWIPSSDSLLFPHLYLPME